MNSYPLYPDDRLRGRPRGRTKKVMNVSMALDVYNALMKIPEGERSGFIANSLRPLAKQFDPGPSSDLVLTLKCLLDSAIEESKRSNDYEKLAAVSSLANEVIPVLNPYLDLCKEDDSKSESSHLQTASSSPQAKLPGPKASEFEVQDKRSIKDIIEDIRTVRIFERLLVILQNAETIHNAVPLMHQDEKYGKDLEEIKAISLAVSLKLGKCNYNADERYKAGEKHLVPVASTDAEEDFRKGLPMYETVNDCKKVLEDSNDISDRDTRELVLKACSFVDSSIRKWWGSGIRLKLFSYHIHPERGTLLVTLFNDGYYDISISGVKCDGKMVRYNAVATSGRYVIGKHNVATLEVRPCLPFDAKKIHSVTFEVTYVRFTFEISGQISQHGK